MAKIVFGMNVSLDCMSITRHFHMIPRSFVTSLSKCAARVQTPPLRLVASDLIGETVIRLTFAPA